MRYLAVAVASLWLAPCAWARETPQLAARIAYYAQRDGVPKSLVERVILRESRFNPKLRRAHFFGLMQIRLATARALGYRGRPEGLLDPDVNLAYGVLYLSNAWRVSGKNPARAMSLYTSGYYFEAKRKRRTALIRSIGSVGDPIDLAAPLPSRKRHARTR